MKNEASSRKRKRATKETMDESEAGYHFIAYMPIGDHLWKFDGLQRQPEKLGEILSTQHKSVREPLTA